MDPKSLTKTNFCNKKIDNVTNNELKKYILNDLYLKTGIKYHYRYAKLYNDESSKYLNNPHIFCLKSSGAPYLLYCTQINDNNYCFLIDKKKSDGYDFPKIFLVQYRFDDLFEGTLFEVELLRDNNNKWYLLFCDIYTYKGDKLLNKNIMDRINLINNIVMEKYINDSFCDVCPIKIKRFFDLCEIDDVLTNFLKKLNYNIKGIYFIPLKNTYSKLLYLFNDNDFKKFNYNNFSVKDLNNKKNINFKIVKTIKPEIYELYLNNENNNGFYKYGYAAIPNLSTSKMISDLFKSDKNDIYVECKFNNMFNKWVPLHESNKLNSINELK